MENDDLRAAIRQYRSQSTSHYPAPVQDTDPGHTAKPDTAQAEAVAEHTEAAPAWPTYAINAILGLPAEPLLYVYPNRTVEVVACVETQSTGDLGKFLKWAAGITIGYNKKRWLFTDTHLHVDRWRAPGHRFRRPYTFDRQGCKLTFTVGQNEEAQQQITELSNNRSSHDYSKDIAKISGMRSVFLTISKGSLGFSDHFGVQYVMSEMTGQQYAAVCNAAATLTEPGVFEKHIEPLFNPGTTNESHPNQRPTTEYRGRAE